MARHSPLYVLVVTLALIVAGCINTAHRTAATPIVVSPQSAGQPAVLPNGEPRESDVVQASQIAYTAIGDGRYRFEYDIRNNGPSACMARVFVILHRLSPQSPNLVSADTDTGGAVCLEQGQSYHVSVEQTLAPGTWGYGAQWSSTPVGQQGIYHCYFGSAPCSPEEDGLRLTVQ
jgi:hypothetical protein